MGARAGGRDFVRLRRQREKSEAEANGTKPEILMGVDGGGDCQGGGWKEQMGTDMGGRSQSFRGRSKGGGYCRIREGADKPCLLSPAPPKILLGCPARRETVSLADIARIGGFINVISPCFHMSLLKSKLAPLLLRAGTETRRNALVPHDCKFPKSFSTNRRTEIFLLSCIVGPTVCQRLAVSVSQHSALVDSPAPSSRPGPQEE